MNIKINHGHKWVFCFGAFLCLRYAPNPQAHSGFPLSPSQTVKMPHNIQHLVQTTFADLWMPPPPLIIEKSSFHPLWHTVSSTFVALSNSAKWPSFCEHFIFYLCIVNIWRTRGGGGEHRSQLLIICDNGLNREHLKGIYLSSLFGGWNRLIFFFFFFL